MSLESIGINAYLRYYKIPELNRVGFSALDAYQALSGLDNDKAGRLIVI